MPKKESFDMIPTTVKLCRIVGLLDRDVAGDTRQRAVVVISGITVFMTIPNLIYLIRKEKNLEHTFRVVIESIALVSIVLRLMFHYINRDGMQACYDDVRSVFNEYVDNPVAEVQKTLKHLYKSAEFLVKFYLYGVMSQAVSFGLIQAVITTVKYFVNGHVEQFPAPVIEADHFFFAYDSSFWIWLPVMANALIWQYYLVVILMANECLHWNLLHHVSCLFKIMSLEILQTNDDGVSSSFRAKIIRIIRLQNVCYKSAEHLEDSLSPVMVLLYCSCILQACIGMFVISVVNNFFLIALMAFIFQYTTFLIFSFSMLSTELIEASVSLSDAVYSLEWYNRTLEEQKLLQFVHMRSQKMVAISAGKFFSMTRATFAGAMRTVFSYDTLMRQFYDK
ncbi:uncharacterized protein LOC129738200 [Uranotaenia lowii]|uniref:uncharacterized protein LOC129738200 n=1 Tax=Uranotaenia lowii TaxID=190385 RepID=UPI0024793BB6|nr:uncharacterized protein LOC129738200 [Uranotaenia lowii]